MSRVDTTVEEPAQLTPRRSSSLLKQLQVADPERVVTEDDENPEFKLPKTTSLAVVLMTNALMQVHLSLFFIIVPSSSVYAQRLGGGETFSGLVIGIPTAISAVTLLPLLKCDKGGYKIPINLCCFASIVGSLCYALAHKANFLYLILIGRMIMGVSFTFFMYAKKYCSDPRIVGIRRRTTLAAYLVVGQGIGLSLGPFLGGALYKIGFGPNGDRLVFNGFTSPGWLMAAVWLLFWGFVTLFFEDVQETAPRTQSSHPSEIELQPSQLQPREQLSGPSPVQLSNPASFTRDVDEGEQFVLGPSQWGVIITMSWFAMTCFFILGSWEANIPIFAASSTSSLGYSPFKSGNLIAIGGAITFPLLLTNIFVGKMVQDRMTLAAGSFIGTVGLIMFEALLIKSSERITFATLLVSWAFVALGFSLATTCTLSLLSKKLPGEWNGRVSAVIQCSNYMGRVTGAIWGGSGVVVGMKNYVGLQIAFVGIGSVLFSTLWRDLKVKTG
ncbi:MFS general substrate transporter [Thelephora terrestris]|uniref:MFS general substrate transporter n=1 Tax=Thelephora terrestris TaxID=56493 RepID=A0A9P6HC05_9AGAM|nr:MFS general substrate transporter [Thelephora terrestris]